MADTQVDRAEDDVRAALSQLRGGTPDSSEPTYQAPEPVSHEHAEPDAALERMAKRASDLIEGKKSEEAEQEQPTTRQRNERGQFAPKAAATSTEFETQLAAHRVSEAIDGLNGKPTRALTKEERAIVDALEPDKREKVLDIIGRLEADGSRGVEMLKSKMGEHIEIAKLLEPRVESFKSMGYKSSAAALQNLMGWSDHIAQDPVGAILHYAQQMQQRGVDIIAPLANQLGLGQQGQAHLAPQQIEQMVGEHQAAKEVARFQQDESFAGVRHPEIKQVMQAALVNGQARGLHDAHDLAVMYLVQQGRQLPDEVVGPMTARMEIAQFAPAHEFFELLRPSMQKLLMEGRAQSLDQAYALAMSQHPRLRALSPAAVKLQQQRRAANASLSGAPHGGQPRSQRNTKSGTYEDAVADVRAAIHQLS